MRTPSRGRWWTSSPSRLHRARLAILAVLAAVVGTAPAYAGNSETFYLGNDAALLGSVGSDSGYGLDGAPGEAWLGVEGTEEI